MRKIIRYPFMSPQVNYLLAAVILAGSILNLAFYLESGRWSRRNPFVLTWSGAGFAEFLGFVLIALHEGNTHWAVFLGDVLVIAGYVLVYQGFRLMHGCPAHWNLAWPALAIVAAAVGWFSMVQPDHAVRISLIALCNGVVGLLIARLLFGSRTRRIVGSPRLTMLMIVVTALSAVVALGAIPFLLRMPVERLWTDVVDLASLVFLIDAMAIAIGLSIALPAIVFARMRRDLEISERRMQYALDAANEGYWDWNLADGSIFLSARFRELVGRPPGGGAPDAAYFESLVHPPDLPAARAGLLAHLGIASDKPFHHECRLAGSPDAPVWIAVAGRAVEFDRNGRPSRLVGTIEDVSERRRTHDELRMHKERLEERVLERTRELASARDQAEQASHAKSILLANMSHELRTPLSQIIGINRIVRREPLSDKAKGLLDKQNEAAHDLLKLVNNLLDTAMLETNRLSIENVDFDLAGLLARAEHGVARRLARKGLALVQEVPDGLVDRLHGDARQLAHVLDELLDNAIKFSTAGPIVLRVAQPQGSGKLISLRCEIEDRGVGIPAAAQERMFELFVQADGSASRRFGGTGLGLALCKRLVALMAGSIGFRSEPGRGSLFWFEVPLTRAHDYDAPAGQSAPDLATGAARMEELLVLLTLHDRQAGVRWHELQGRFGFMLGEAQRRFDEAMASADFGHAADLLRRALHAAP